jgi:hypothetical protein
LVVFISHPEVGAAVPDVVEWSHALIYIQGTIKGRLAYRDFVDRLQATPLIPPVMVVVTCLWMAVSAVPAVVAVFQVWMDLATHNTQDTTQEMCPLIVGLE